MTRRALPISLAAWLLACTAAWSQPARPDSGPAFSLWSSQVYRTAEQAACSLTYRGLDHLDFRVYRVADPEAFFGGLKDPHALGSEKPVVPEERSWIERIAAWKAAQRAVLRAKGMLNHCLQATRDSACVFDAGHCPRVPEANRWGT